MKISSIALCLAAGCLVSGTLRATEPLTVPVKRLTLETALKVAQGAMEACRNKGIQIAVAVVDRDATLQVKLRDTIAPPITLELSERKAYTAVNFNAPTSQLLSRSESALGRVDSIIFIEGGIPIEVGGNLMGAVGVSGAPVSTTDEECAKAGIDKVLEDLELGV